MKKVLIISKVDFLPVNAGNKQRIFTLIKLLMSQNCVVDYLYITEISIEKVDLYDKVLNGRLLSIPKSFSRNAPKKQISPTIVLHKIINRVIKTPNKPIDYHYPRYLSQFVIENNLNMGYDIVIAEYVYLSKVLKLFPNNTLKIIDTHDRLGNRNKLLKNYGIKNNWYSFYNSSEKKGLKRADYIISIQEKESEYFANLIKKKEKILTIGQIFSPNPLSFVSEKKIVLFVGSDNSINTLAINDFISDVWPLVEKAMPDIQLWIVGKVCKNIKHFSDTIFLKGEVESLDNYYKLSSIVVNPIKKGTGLKIKTLEAISFGRTVLSYPEGIAGLEKFHIDNFKIFAVANSSMDMANLIITVIKSGKYRNVSDEALAFLNTYNSKAAAPLFKLLNQ